tara:strand:+ start:365 stop:505 length:141 start_codon:yes stop_codon:yes gene_type:complete
MDNTIKILIIIIVFGMTSCSDKVLSAHGQESDYYYELKNDKKWQEK